MKRLQCSRFSKSNCLERKPFPVRGPVVDIRPPLAKQLFAVNTNHLWGARKRCKYLRHLFYVKRNREILWEIMQSAHRKNLKSEINLTVDTKCVFAVKM